MQFFRGKFMSRNKGVLALMAICVLGGFHGLTAQADQTGLCVPDAQGNTSNSIFVNTGSEENFDWGEASACVARPIRDAWGVLHNQDLIVWGGVNESSYESRTDLPAGTSHFYEVNYKVKKFIITVEWVMDWLHQITQGTMQDPKEVKITYSKVSGTSYIEYWEGTVTLNAISPSLTQVVVHNAVKAERQNAEKAGQTAHDLLAKIQTGDPNLEPLK